MKLADAYDIANAKLKEATQNEEGAAPPAYPSSQSGDCIQAYSVPLSNYSPQLNMLKHHLCSP